MTAQSRSLPHWDMTPIYPALDSPEFEAGFQRLIGAIADLVAFFDRHGIDKRKPAPLDDATTQTFEETVNALNAVLYESRTVNSYVNSFVATDSRNTLAQAKQSELQQHMVRLTMLGTRLTAWIGALDVEALVARSAVARDHAFMLHKAQVEASHQMSPAEEALAAELRPTGALAWFKLHNNFTSQIVVRVELADGVAELPMSMVRNLASEPDRETRRRAYEAELAAWKAAALSLAAALNSIKGATGLLSQRRRWESALDTTLFDNNIDSQTLDAMMSAARESFPDFRRYLRAKARGLGLPRLAWYDLFAPLAAGEADWSYAEGQRFIIEHFGSYSPKLRGLAERAFREQWIDAEPRTGKRDGAFCMAVRGDESRVSSNFKPTFGGVSTLAHELGHAYHNLNLAQRTMLQRQTPMTLAETASIFCQTLVSRAALQRAAPQEQVVLLEASLQNACQVVVDISSRFLFEQRVFERRQRRELSVDEFCALMVEAQLETYGDGLDPEQLHPYMWAMKPHYYSATFYNYPYMFGLLFGLGLYARYQADPERFKAGYDELLSATGMGNAAELAARFGINTRSPDFWRASLDVVRGEIAQFEALVG